MGLLVVGCVEYNLGDSEVLTMFLTTVCFGYLAKETVEAGVIAVTMSSSRRSRQ
jgi:hypothetical protein